MLARRCLMSMFVASGLVFTSSFALGQAPRGKPAAAAKPAAQTTPPLDLRALGDAFVGVAEKTSPSVVQLNVTLSFAAPPTSFWVSGDSKTRSLASGVIFSSDGAILTNNHVVEGALSIDVRLKDGRTLVARLVGRDPATDLAVIRVDATNLPAATFADSDSARVGEWVVAIGSPFGLGFTVTTGVLSAKGRVGVGVNAIEDYLQTDASINPGNSGGPLVNLDGKVLGVNTMSVSRGQGIGLAVPANIALRVANQLLKNGFVTRPFIGIGLQDLTPEIAAEMPQAPSAGGLVNAVVADGPASKAHLEPGDIVTKIGSRVVVDAQDILRELFLHDVGEVLSLDVVRAGKRYQTKVTLEARREPAPEPLPMERQPKPQSGLGLLLRDVARDVPSSAEASLAQIVGIAPDSPAERAGLQRGDVVLEADGGRLPTAEDIKKSSQDGHLLLRVRRDNATFFVVVR